MQILKRIVIVSSAEGQEGSKYIQSQFVDFDIVSIFDEAFYANNNILDSIIMTAKAADFAIFLFTPDDLVLARGNKYQSARDNILVEFGIYIGLLGRNNVFAIMPATENFKIPSDFQGINFASYSTSSIESLNAACKYIKRNIAHTINTGRIKFKVEDVLSDYPEKCWNVFLSYSRKDILLKDELNNHLAQLRRNKKISTWSDYEILPGQVWEERILQALNNADLILLLISSDFLASDYCNKEMLLALERHKEGVSVVVPIILRACDWLDTEFSVLNALPHGCLPIKLWDDQDRAFLDVVLGLKSLLL